MSVADQVLALSVAVTVPSLSKSKRSSIAFYSLLCQVRRDEYVVCRTILMCCQGDEAAVCAMIKNDPLCVEARDDLGRTALSIACCMVGSHMLSVGLPCIHFDLLIV